MPANITHRVSRRGEHRWVVRYRLPGGRTQPLAWGGSFHTLGEAEVRRDAIRRLLAAGVDPMTETDAQALLRTVLCSHPACGEDAETGRSTCRRHRADRSEPTAHERALAAVADGRLCKVGGCPGEPVVARGPFAGLCREHADLKRSAHGSRIAHGMQAAGEGSPRRPVTTPLGVVKALQQTARDLERAQARYDTAKAELNRARRAWKTALQDAAVSS